MKKRSKRFKEILKSAVKGKKITAKEIINMLNNKYGSTGGGREDLAQAGLEYENNLDDLAINIKKYISEIVSSKEN